MQKILLTCEDFLPLIGGAEICVFNLANELRNVDYQVTIFTNTPSQELQEDGVIRVPWSFTPSALWKNIHMLWKLCRKSDIVHCQYSFRLACICAIICRIQKKPMLLTQQGRGIVPEANTLWYYRPFYIFCQWVSMKGASLLTSTSKEITDLTSQFVARSKIVEITNGYNSQQFYPNISIAKPIEFEKISSDKKIILTVRRLVPKNGIHILIQSLQYVKERYDNFHYFAIGTGRMHSEIADIVHTLKLSDHVTLLGSVPNEQLAQFYKHADVVIVPSSAEATSIACIEAMAMQKPIIASKVGGLIDLIGLDEAYGSLVDIYDSNKSQYNAPATLSKEKLELLAIKIIDVFTNAEQYDIKAKSAAEFARTNFSWSVITQQYIQLYNRLILP